MRPLLFFLLMCQTTVFGAVDQCDVCHKIAQYVNSLKGESYDKVHAGVESIAKNFPADERTFIGNVLLRYNFGKIYKDANSKANGMTVGTTCADMGFCDVKGEFKSPFPIVNNKNSFWDSHSQLRDDRDRSIIVLHHTVSKTLQVAIKALEDRGLSVQYIVDVDGKVYQLVDDFRRAWQAGLGTWRGDGCLAPDDTNGRSIGIETVNMGDEPFPEAQVKGINELIKYLATKWHIEPQNIISHAENSPWYKFDISSYFSWKRLYDELGMFQGVWPTKLTHQEMKEVVLSSKVHNAALLKEVQQKLYDYGQGGIVVGDPYATSTKSKVTTALAIQSFNRKFCPEVFIKESVKNGNEVTHPENEQVYKLTLERLNWLHAHRPAARCTNH